MFWIILVKFKVVFSCAVLFSSSYLIADEGLLISEIERIESHLDARVGFAAYDTESDMRWEYNSEQRFALASTFKTLACAALLARVDAGSEQLTRSISVSSSDLVTYSPVLEEYADNRNINLSELCEATMTISDNTAANLILQSLGGPESVTAFARQLGDDVTRLDRWETELNEAVPGDERDTTTPNAMIGNLEQLLLGNVLTEESINLLKTWLINNQVADDLFRSVKPDGWIIGDRTGAGGFGSRAITAVIWPPERKPIFVAFYITETTASFEERNAAIEQLGRVLMESIESSE
ncbi:class A beta-lactamase [Natronospirillum operosum]|uniref:Beta-lactamase n=1 Tax=Natronospirillum operosum TaxID=2759953 RepID=A0A4Z0WEX8_9GAMM|nr:class A beta-lactamase [Natronospirillum operosum]TGG95590.1 class A beta-lactamase [Natronospirillum operosum]